MLEERAIERNVVGDAIEDNGVARRLMEVDCASLNKLRLNAGWISVVDPLDEGAGETVLHAEEDTDDLHGLVLYTLRGRLKT